MKRLLGCLVLVAAGMATLVVIYTGAARDREYRRLIAEGDRALARDDTFGAVEAYSGAIALRGDSMLGYLRRGETYHRRRDFDAALRDLREAARLDPTATRPLEQLGDIQYALQRYGRAAERYSQFARLDNRNARVLYKLGLSRYRDGNVAAAIAALRQAIQLDGRLEEAFYLLGLCLRDEQRFDEALETLRRASTMAAGSIEVREALANLYADLGRTRDEIEQLEALAVLNPNRPDRLVSLALAYGRAERTDLAVLTLGRAAERYPEQADVYLALASLWLDVAEGMHDRVALSKALEALEKASGPLPLSREALTLRGRALLLAGDVRRAQRVLQQATAQLPLTPRAFWYLAEAAERVGDAATARDALVKYNALAPPGTRPSVRARYFARLGELSMQLGEPEVAATWFARAAEVDTPSAGLLGRLAEARWRTGEEQAARELLERALQRDPTNQAALALRGRMAAGR